MTFQFLKDMRRGDAFTLSAYSLGAHSGTHIDAPMHFILDGLSVDRVPLEPLIGPARVLDIPDNVRAIDAAELNRHRWRGAQRVLFRTRSSLRGWMRSPSFHRDFAYVAPDAAQLLADAGVQLIGIDYISAEQFGAPAPRSHRILLGKGIPIVEGLLLETIRAGDYDLIVLPMKVAGPEGAPRAGGIASEELPAASCRAADVRPGLVAPTRASREQGRHLHRSVRRPPGVPRALYPGPGHDRSCRERYCKQTPTKAPTTAPPMRKPCRAPRGSDRR